MITTNDILLSKIELVREVIRFFLAKEIEPSFHKEICKKIITERLKDTEVSRIKSGMLTTRHFLSYKGSTNLEIVKWTLIKMQECHLLKTFELMIQGAVVYEATPFSKLANQMGIVENMLFGFEYIIKKYRNSVCKIENTDSKGGKDIGTGFLIDNSSEILLITNNHVLQGSSLIKVYDVEDNLLEHSILYTNEEKDIAFLKVNSLLATNYFSLSNQIKVLSSIITIGYPSVPMTKEAYQICHKGEVNSMVEDYRGNSLFLISAKTSSGNSGSPVVDESGFVIGIITQELFEQDALISKGKLPYYAVIPTTVIIEELTKYRTGIKASK